ncbi:MAG: ComEC/Rec2 family competence protein [Candidatus Eisenbacteria sp.]|nr:ComEC/Rec2 family competence protein [Candidatus Eisenbacteria bacterium]
MAAPVAAGVIGLLGLLGPGGSSSGSAFKGAGEGRGRRCRLLVVRRCAADPVLLLGLLLLLGLVRGSAWGAEWLRAAGAAREAEGLAYVEFAADGTERGATAHILRVRPVGAAKMHPLRLSLRLMGDLPGDLTVPGVTVKAKRLHRGRLWSGYAVIEAPRGPRFPGAWDPEAYLRSQGMAGWLRPLGARRSGAGADRAAGTGVETGLGSRLSAGRRRLRAGLAAALLGQFGREAGSFAARVLLRWDGREQGAQKTQEEQKGQASHESRAGYEKHADHENHAETLARAGLGHLFAVSGLHVGLIGGAAALLLQLLPVGRRTRGVLLSAWLCAYASLVGWSPSVTRAVSAVLLWSLLRAAGRRPQAHTLLLIVLAATLWCAPGAWRGTGMQFTYLVSLAIVAALGCRRQGRRRGGRAIFVLVAAQGAAWPLILAQQGGGSPLYLVTNGLLLPAFGALVGAVLLGAVFAWVPGFPIDVAAAPGIYLISAFLGLAEWGGRLCEQSWCAAEVGTGVALAASLLVLLAWQLPRVPGGLRLIAGPALGALLLLIGSPQRHAPRVLMLDVGQGESWMVCWRRETWLIDAGPPPGEAGRAGKTIGTVLRGAGRRRIDHLLLTHDDRDHAGGLVELDALGIPVDSIHHPVGWVCGRATGDWIAARVRRGAGVRSLQAGDTLRSREGSAAIVHPPPGGVPGSGKNAGCLALRLQLGGLEILVTGDLPGETLEKWGPAEGAAPAAVLSAAHHGSGGSTPAALLRRVAPRVVAISVGRRNRFGMPAPATLARIGARGAHVYRTDRDGSLVFEQCGGGWRVRGTASRRWVALTGAGGCD